MENYYTTSEAAKILGVSVSTIQRYFDGQKKKAKLLAGDKNPLTGRRRISPYSIYLLSEKYNMDVDLSPKEKEKKNEIR